MGDFQLSHKQAQVLAWLKDAESEKVFYGGGAGSAKSFLGCYWQIKNRALYPGTRGVIARNQLNVLKESTLKTFWFVCQKLEIQAGVHYKYNDNKSKIIWKNGSETLMMDLYFKPSDPDFQRFGSTEYTDAFIDEAPEITEKAHEILFSRLRWRTAHYGLKPKMLLTGNPSDCWVKTTFVKTPKGFINLPPELKRLLATVIDNPDKKFVAAYMKTLEGLTSEYDKARLLYGDWDAVPRTGKEIYHPFNLKDHQRDDIPYDPGAALHIAVDINIVPYITALVYQIKYISETGRYQVHGVSEYCLEHPQNSMEWVASYFAKEFPDHTAGVFYYGDFSGKNSSSLREDRKHYFAVLEAELAKYLDDKSDRVIPNARGIARRDFLLDIFLGKTPIDFSIDSSMMNTRNDFLFMKQGPDGLKYKQRVIDPITLTSYEKYGHTSDATEYFLTSAFDDYFYDYELRTNSR